MVRVRAMRLGGDCPAALRDTTRVFDLAIDFSHDPTEITAALEALMQEAIDSHRWTRRQGAAGSDVAAT